MDAKIFRVNYKSDFILTLTSDAGWMTPFCIKFWTGSPMLAYYASYDGETYTHCTYDPSEPTKLTVQFDDHHLPIGNLKYQVAYHFTVADFPENTEDEVTNQANVTTVIDGETYHVMLDLNGETAPEIQFALPAYANELQRIQNEQTRIAQEQQRIAQEQTRISQEAARVTEFNGIVNTANNDHVRANEDHSRAQTDHQNALADRSQAASDHSRAQSDHNTATSDHSQANSDYIRAQSDHNTALSDHQTALSDHTQSNTDHTRAESDHTRATADSSTAAADHRTASTDHTQANTDHARAESDHQRVETDLAEVEEFSNSLGAYDISAAHATGSTLATYPDLATALGTNGSNIPEALRKGGMSVKFVLTYDNNSVYVQYRLMKDSFSTAVGDWQGVDDVITAGSKNLAKSGDVKFAIDSLGQYVLNNYLEGKGVNYVSKDIYGLVPGRKYIVILKSNTWDISGITGDDLSKFTIRSYYDGSINAYFAGVLIPDQVEPYYEITIPDNCDFIRIGGRAAEGVNIYFNIFDIAYKAEMENLVGSVDGLVLNNNLIGNGDTYVSKDLYGLAPGRIYRVVLKDASWDVTGITNTGYKWRIASFYNNTVSELVGVYMSGTVVPYYDIIMPANSDFVRIGCRASDGTKVNFSIVDLSAIYSQVGVCYDKSNTFIARTLTGVSDPADNPNGIRIRIVMAVKAGMKAYAKTTDSLGLNCGIWSSFSNAINASPSSVVEVVSEGYTSGFEEKTISNDGYLCISLTNGSTAISNVRKQEMLNALSFAVGSGTLYDISDTVVEVRKDIADIETYISNNENDVNTYIENVVNKDLCETAIVEIIPNASQAYNAYYRTSQPTNFCADSEYLKRLTYFPEVLVAGGSKVTINYTGRNSIRVYELPYRDLGSSPINAYTTGTDFIGTHDLVPSSSSDFTGSEEITLSRSCRRLAFVLGSTRNENISPSEITQEITKLTLTVYEPFKLKGNNANNYSKFIERVAQAKYVDASPTTNSLGLLHFSDIHGDQIAADTINNYLKDISSYIDDVICTGDSVHYYADGTSTYPQGSTWWNEDSGLSEKSLFVLGNHDGATPATTSYDQQEGSAAWDGKGKDWCFETYIEPYINQRGITMPEGYDNPSSPNYNACYWHKDYAQQKIRIIGLDCIHRFDGVVDPETGEITTPGLKWTTNEQELWLISKLNEIYDANNAAYGYNVIVICHYPIDDFDGNNEVWDDSAHKWIYNHKFNGGRVISYKSSAPVVFHNESVVEYYAEARFNMRNRVDDGYSQSQPYPNYTKGTTNNIGEIIKAWMDNHPDNMTQGKMIAWLCGHTHMDYMWYSLKYPDILCVVIDQAGCLRGTNTGDRDATLESRTCANYYSIDTQNGLLKIVRIGYTMNKLMNSHEYLCYDYVNKKVLNEG